MHNSIDKKNWDDHLPLMECEGCSQLGVPIASNTGRHHYAHVEIVEDMPVITSTCSVYPEHNDLEGFLDQPWSYWRRILIAMMSGIPKRDIIKSGLITTYRYDALKSWLQGRGVPYTAALPRFLVEHGMMQISELPDPAPCYVGDSDEAL